MRQRGSTGRAQGHGRGRLGEIETARSRSPGSGARSDIGAVRQIVRVEERIRQEGPRVARVPRVHGRRAGLQGALEVLDRVPGEGVEVRREGAVVRAEAPEHLLGEHVEDVPLIGSLLEGRPPRIPVQWVIILGWTESERSHLREHLDAQGDLAPPWEQLPQYTRYTIGWRMGMGEDSLIIWSLFRPEADHRRNPSQSGGAGG